MAPALPAVLPMSEAERLRVLRSYAVLDTPAEPALDRITDLARLALDAPIAAISLVDADRLWFKSKVGFDACQVDRERAFCAHSIALPKGSVLTVPDASTDPRFNGNVMVAAQNGVRFYAGAVLTSPEGAPLGALCVLDNRVRPGLTPLQEQTLRALADMAVGELEVQRTHRADASKRRMLELAEAMSRVGHWRYDIAAQTVSWSDEVYRIHGVERGDYDPSLDDGLSFYAEDERAGVAEKVAAAVRDRSGFSFHARITRRDGERREVLCKAACELGPKGEALALIGVFQDVTEQQTLLREVSAERERYRLLADNANDMISTTAVDDSRILFISPACRRVLGWAPEELIGRGTLALTHPDDRADVVRHFTALLSAGPSDRVAPYQFRGRHKDGSWVWLEGQPRVRFDAEGRPLCFQDVVRDVTQRKQLEARLEGLREAAEAGARAKTDFLANMSHELRTPLTGILGYADVLAASPDLGPEARRHLERLRRSGETLLDLVNDVMDLSKIEARGLDLEARAVDLGELLTGAMDSVRPQAEAKALRLSGEWATPAPSVLADGGRLRQVVLNLLGNAVKFTDKGEVRLRLSSAPGADGRVDLLLSVEDTGVGVSAEQLGRIFGRFEQADASTTRRFGGTGLGLAISRAIVERMGGELRARSTPGRGSVFEVRLSAPAAAPPAAAPVRLAATGAPALAGRKVLLAEDVALNRELIALLLSASGVRLTSVANGAEAVDAAGRESFDAVLMDVQMPVLDGVEATRRIRASGGPNAATPIIALTANVLPTEVALCREAGMVGHVAKPFTADGLAGALESALAA